jgi:pyruvate ferredoxin oxidoreductase delta subunit
MTQIKQTKSKHFNRLAKKASPKGGEFGAIIENEQENYPRIGGWKDALFSVNEKCIGCGMCEKYCPEATIRMKMIGDRKYALINPEFCKGCGICASVCPALAIDNKKI